MKESEPWDSTQIASYPEYESFWLLNYIKQIAFSSHWILFFFTN